MNNNKLRTQTKRRIRYAIYITAMVVAAALVVYLNYRHEEKLVQLQKRVVQIQERLDEDARFRQITLRVDKEMSTSTLSGSVATQQDLNALVSLISKTAPLPGTRIWKYEVDIAKK